MLAPFTPTLCVYAVGWSDVLLFAIFENGHTAADKVYLYELNPKNQQISLRARQSFLFFLISENFKMKILFLNLQTPSFYIKENSPKRKFEIKNIKYLFMGPKMGKVVFALNKGKMNLFSVSLHL